MSAGASAAVFVPVLYAGVSAVGFGLALFAGFGLALFAGFEPALFAGFEPIPFVDFESVELRFAAV